MRSWTQSRSFVSELGPVYRDRFAGPIAVVLLFGVHIITTIHRCAVGVVAIVDSVGDVTLDIFEVLSGDMAWNRLRTQMDIYFIYNSAALVDDAEEAAERADKKEQDQENLAETARGKSTARAPRKRGVKDEVAIEMYHSDLHISPRIEL